MPDVFGDVRKFHRKFGVGPADDKPHLPAPDVLEFRYRFLEEELHEFRDAVSCRDLEKAVDGLIDLIYVAAGTLDLMAAPTTDCWQEVQRANMAKERATSAEDSRSKRGHSLDVVKPEGWTPPDLAQFLFDEEELRKRGYDV